MTALAFTLESAPAQAHAYPHGHGHGQAHGPAQSRPDPFMQRGAAAAPSDRSLEPLLAGLDGLAHGVALFDISGRLRYANANAHALLTRLQAQEQGRARAEGASERPRRWADALNRVCHRGLRELFEIASGAGGTSVAYAAMVPVMTEGERLAFVTFGKDDICGPVELQMFASRYGLTSMECRVLRQLCRGHKATEIALLHGVSKSTVLTQIAAVRSKTQSRSVRELMDTLSRMPPLNPALAVCN
jgi:DNA-binding CsgD family transcriptional regulator